MSRRWLLNLFLPIVFTLCANAQTTPPPSAIEAPTAKTGDELKTLLTESYGRNTFNSLQGPYHLLATFQTFDADGHPAGEGSVEKYFFSPGNLKVITKFAGHTSTAYYTEDKPLYTSDGFTGSILSYFVREFLLHPLVPPAGFVKRETQTTARTLLGTTMDCANFRFEMMAPNLPQPPLDSYCVSRDTHDLVMHQTENFTVRYRDFQPFQDLSIARTIVASKGSQTRIRIKIEAVDTAVLPEAELQPPANASPVDPGPEIRAYDGSKELLQTGGVDPMAAPREDRAAHIAGLAIVYALVSREGKVIDVELRVVSKPELTKIALDTARSASYKPLIRQGMPVENIKTVVIPLRY